MLTRKYQKRKVKIIIIINPFKSHLSVYLHTYTLRDKADQVSEIFICLEL